MTREKNISMNDKFILLLIFLLIIWNFIQTGNDYLTGKWVMAHLCYSHDIIKACDNL